MLKQYRDHDLGLFLLRLGLAAVFIAHGWQKLQNLQGVVGFFGTLGLHPFFAYLVAWVELLGGVAMLIGAYTYIAGAALAVNMAAAIYLARFPQGFVGGYELEFMLLLAAVTVTLLGPGRHVLSEKLK